MIDPLSSTGNDKVKHVRRLLAERRYRRRERAFVVEGTRWMQEVVQERIAPQLWFATPEWTAENDDLTAALENDLNARPWIVTPELAAYMADTETPSGVLAVLDIAARPWPTQPSLLLVLDAVRDPGNAGTLIRTAAAAGVDGLICTPGTVDVYNPKAVRSTMGGLLRLPIAYPDWAQVGDLLGETDLYLAAGEANTVYTAVDWTRPAALVIGSEAHGAGPRLRERAHTAVSIPMHRSTESLNAAAAAAVILFEAARQRRGKG